MMQPGRTLDWDRMTPAERAAWQLLLSWRRGGVLVQRAFIATHVN